MRSQRDIQNERINQTWQRKLKAEKRIKPKKPKLYVPPISSVTSCVASYYNLSYHRLINCRHSKIVARQRWMLFYICKRILGYSFRKITKALRLAEGTVYRGLKLLVDLLLVDPNLMLDIRAIRIKLNRRCAR